MVIGSVLALIVPKVVWIGLFGRLFVGALKAIAPILVFVLVIASLTQNIVIGEKPARVCPHSLAAQLKSIRKIISKVIYYVKPIEVFRHY